MAPDNQLTHDEQGPSVGDDLRGPGNWTVLVVLLHAASLHGPIEDTSSKKEPCQSGNCTCALRISPVGLLPESCQLPKREVFNDTNEVLRRHCLFSRLGRADRDARGSADVAGGCWTRRETGPRLEQRGPTRDRSAGPRRHLWSRKLRQQIPRRGGPVY